ncbi:adenylate cyclase type 9 isoform X1 [Syngnathus scovelli]|uniref:adenylate cyclase type 9 isoform X1 n=1 Tax=Syngnathus scovelli TaxID=161590 RepID=UPI0021103582|nr:adenylate cyclase type 9 isoform X1 [Syngnathus scovelli]
MASPQRQQLLPRSTEASCHSSGEGVSVRLGVGRHKHEGGQPVRCHAAGSKRCKYSISSSCSSSGESSVKKTLVKSFRSQKRVPQLFERSASHFWDPKFDSSILEEACRERCFPQTRRRFRYALFYLSATAALWGFYFAANPSRCNRTAFLFPTTSFLLFCLLLLLLTFTKVYSRCYDRASLLLIVVTLGLTLVPQIQTTGLGERLDAVGLGGPTHNLSCLETGGRIRSACVSPVGTFSLCVQVLLLLYSVLRMRLFASILLGLLYSLCFETLGWFHLTCTQGGALSLAPDKDLERLCWLAPAKALLHLCAHAVGVHLFVMSEVRSRSTFLKVGQSIMHGKDLEVEKALKERMIHSVMPRTVADELMKQGDEDTGASASRAAVVISSPKGDKGKKASIPRGQIIFRPFNMKRMEPVSILFADIVGFTKMSANKSAHALVGLLNDLFGRFDQLCELSGCEKISTLGDCYYCVAGCPEPRPDHAYCCVEMGLGMIRAIETFCREKREMVNMRVGVHTGTVLCGILGMKRFKFDVWSNDVNLANLMEQLGVAGKVHLSQATADFLDERYPREDGRVDQRIGAGVVAAQLKGLRTYLISRRKWDKPPLCSCSNSRCCSQGAPPPDGASGLPLPPCPSCSFGEERVLEEGDVKLPGCRKERETGNGKAAPAKVRNGLLGPRPEALNNSQTSLRQMLQEEKKTWAGGALGMDQLRSKNFRERSDAHFVDVIKGDSLMKDYFYRPPIHKLGLAFLDKSLESAYRFSYRKEVVARASVRTFASPTFGSFLDVLLCSSVFLALSLACFLRPMVTGLSLPTPAVIVTTAAALLQASALIFAVRVAFWPDAAAKCTRTLTEAASGWMARHFIGAVTVSLPALAVFSHVTCDGSLQFICCAFLIAIVQFCNACPLSYWMRSSLATLVGLALLSLLFTSPCRSDRKRGGSNSSGLQWDTHSRARDLLGPEACVALFLLLLLVWFLSRESEVSYRLHYHGNVEADQHRIKIQNMRDQADWLLRNIIPVHVAEQLKVTQSYSKNHDNVGVIFASVVNFGDFYEESYEGGKECYRVLNELIGDFDELLRTPAFADIEKIKTIGATYMAAAGLNAQRCAGHPGAHLHALFEFALEMMRVVDDFNKNMLGFGFKLRVGFNHGPLTAGVIGTTKLLYDIWGDTVNIASRMDTTGVECRVQVSEESYCALSGMGFDFDYRGTVNVKGKGRMKTFLYPKCDGGGGPVPQYQLSVSPEIRAQVDGSIGRSPTDEIAAAVSSAAAGDNGMVPSVSAGSTCWERGEGLQRHARRSVSHGGLTCAELNDLEAANESQFVVSPTLRRLTFPVSAGGTLHPY